MSVISMPRGLTAGQQRVYKDQLLNRLRGIRPRRIATFYDLVEISVDNHTGARLVITTRLRTRGPDAILTAALAVIDARGPVVPIPSDASPDEDKQFA